VIINTNVVVHMHMSRHNRLVTGVLSILLERTFIVPMMKEDA